MLALSFVLNGLVSILVSAPFLLPPSPDKTPVVQDQKSQLKTVLQIVEVKNEKYGITDRCLSCHGSNGGPNPGIKPDPFQFHSPELLKAHPTSEFGCAICHGGNSLASDKMDAHGLKGDATRPVLTGVWVQSSCTGCHQTSEISGAEILKKGLNLVSSLSCVACHKVPNIKHDKRLAPTLHGLKNKVHSEWLIAWLMNPKGYFENARMPHFYLSAQDALAVSSYLMSLPSEDLKTADVTQVQGSKEAKKLLKQYACLDCHTVHGKDDASKNVPDLSRIGDKVNKNWLIAWLKNPQHLQPGAEMPSFKFSDVEANLIASYLTKTHVTSGKEQLIKPSNALRGELIEKGHQLVNNLGCLNCHGTPEERSKTMEGPDLSLVGELNINKYKWGDVSHKRGSGLSEFLRMKIQMPRTFSSHARMPNFGLTPKDNTALVVALMSFKKKLLPMGSMVATAELVKPISLPGGRAGEVFSRYQCFSCHALRGELGELAPDLGYEGDKVHKGWLANYLKKPYLLRPEEQIRMPNFGLKDNEISAIVDYMENEFKDIRIPGDPFNGHTPSDDLVTMGNDLFWDEYECQECHQIGDEGESEGPDLDFIGDRLKPGWIFQWIKDPQEFYENEMPDPEVEEEHIKALTAYLMSLREKGRD